MKRIIFICFACLCIATASLADAGRMLQPSDLFPGFPQIHWGMSFNDARLAIERTSVRGISPVVEIHWVKG